LFVQKEVGAGMKLHRTAVLIIGAGAAGLRAAIELKSRGVPCLVMGRRAHGDAHSVKAAGGINGSLGNRDPDDAPRMHAADTIREGHYVCDPEAVRILSEEAPARLLELAEWGCPFNRTDEGLLDQRYFGAQSFRRTAFAGDSTGRAILDTLVRKAKEIAIEYMQGVYLTDLSMDEAGVVYGATGFDTRDRSPLRIDAHAVVLAAGGYTGVYARSSSREGENTGDALWLALRAGCSLRDVEFVQFHPTGMVHPEGMAGTLVTEAVRGEGGYLLNAKGERFMERYSPESMELDARDVVARAIHSEIRAGLGTARGGVLLDVSHQSPEFIRERLPRIEQRFSGLGIDVTKEPMEVAPTAHYGMGGVVVDFRTGWSGVPGLFAVGEATGGLHGANRLGGNSLAETVVFGKLTGAYIAGELANEPAEGPRHRDMRPAEEPVDGGAPEYDAVKMLRDLREILWDAAGIVRDRARMERGLQELLHIGEVAGIEHTGTILRGDQPVSLYLRQALLVGECILRGALAREESRGAHYREDFPEEKDAFRKTLRYRLDGQGRVSLEWQAVPPVDETIRRTLAEGHHLDYHHLE
jgi:succinate dehydrogenase / fumarate reductase, flavoprotein subunit